MTDETKWQEDMLELHNLIVLQEKKTREMAYKMITYIIDCFTDKTQYKVCPLYVNIPECLIRNLITNACFRIEMTNSGFIQLTNIDTFDVYRVNTLAKLINYI
jgi:hypothetical protein